MILEIAVAVLGFLVVVLAGVSYQLSLKLRQQAVLHKERDAMRDQRMRDLAKRLDTYLAGNIRMGEQLHELRRVVAPLPDKLSQIEQRDPASLSFSQAARLAGMGASVEDLTQSCGLSKAEAELVSRLHGNNPES